jgi:hypothetical protein
MKKIIFFSIVFIIIMCGWKFLYYLAGAPHPIDYIGWKDVLITEIGTFKIPKDWIITQKGNAVFITDKPMEDNEFKIYLAGVIKNKNYNPYDYEFFSNAEKLDTISSSIYSNEAYHGLGKYCINGDIKEMYYLVFYNYDDKIRMELLTFDNLLDEQIIIKILISYKYW